MTRLEDLKKGARVRGVTPTGPVTVIDVEWVGADTVTLTYEDGVGGVDRELLYRANEDDLELVDGGRPWSLDADPALFKLVAEAKRISLAYLFDPYLATERALGRDPTEMPHNNEGYDVETRGGDGRLLFIEVKGRVAGADRFTITDRELNYGLNNADRHILALVRVDEDDTTTVRYHYDPFGGREFAPSAAEYDRRLSWDTYWNLAAAPR